MKKGFLLADNKEKKKRTQQRVVADGSSESGIPKKDTRCIKTKKPPQTTGSLSMKGGFLLRSASRRKCNQSEGRKIDDKATNQQCTAHNKRRNNSATPSAALLGFEDSLYKPDGCDRHTNGDIVPTPSLIVATDAEESKCSHSPPLIVETDGRPIEEISETIVCGEDPENGDNNADCNNQGSIISADTTADTKDAFAFANEVSKFLSRLRRALKSSNQSKKRDKGSTIGIKQFVNEQSANLIKTFVEQNLCTAPSIEKGTLLRQLWTLILQHILFRKKKKHSRSTNSVSSQLALGIGVLEFCTPFGLALESIADYLSSLANSIIVKPNQNAKQCKIDGMGAILLLRCHFCCISKALEDNNTCSKEQPVTNSTYTFQRIETETIMMLNKILHPLRSIILDGQKRTILSTIAADAFFELIEIFARVCALRCDTSIASPHNIIWKDTVLPCMEEVIDMKRHWLTQKEADISVLRYHCSAAIMNEWLNKSRHFIDCLAEPMSPDAYRQLILIFSGVKYQYPDASELAWVRIGGVAQSLCQHEGLMAEGKKLEAADFLLAISSDSSSKLDLGDNMILVRAFVSLFAKNDKAFRVLSNVVCGEESQNERMFSHLLDILRIYSHNEGAQGGRSEVYVINPMMKALCDIVTQLLVQKPAMLLSHEVQCLRQRFCLI
jgi:hypothetical protein